MPGDGKKITIQIIQAAVQPCIVSDSEYHKEAGRIYYTRAEYPVKNTILLWITCM